MTRTVTAPDHTSGPDEVGGAGPDVVLGGAGTRGTASAGGKAQGDAAQDDSQAQMSDHYELLRVDRSTKACELYGCVPDAAVS